MYYFRFVKLQLKIGNSKSFYTHIIKHWYHYVNTLTLLNEYLMDKVIQLIASSCEALIWLIYNVGK
jgi:hypothetical protein